MTDQKMKVTIPLIMFPSIKLNNSQAKKKKKKKKEEKKSKKSLSYQ